MQWNEFRSAIKHMSANQQTRIKQAFELGERVHGDQKRKSGEPYFNHPITVATMLANMGADPDTIVAALLHDTVEDTDLTLPEIEGQFGPTVRTLIEGVTKLSVSDVGGPNVDEQTETLRKIFTLMETDVRIMVIKIIDRLHNMQTVEFLKEERQRTLSQETQDVYVKIADRLCMQDIRDELEALCLGILEPAVFKRLVTLREENQTKGTAVVKDMKKRLETHFPEHADSVQMRHEDKSWDSLREQLNTDGTAVTGVSGLTAVFVCDEVSTCYQVLGILHQMWKRESMSFQDFINTPTINGYRGLHTTVILEDGTRVRCKIRTQQMHEYARKGVTTLCFRSDNSALHEWLPWTQRISPLSEDTRGRSKEFWDTLQSDILGESILIYGPGDQTMLVPKGSTALDGALYLFGKEALRITSLGIGGKETALDTPLHHAVSLNVVLGDKRMADREWLDKAQTGFATAIIRGALVEGKTDTEKIPIGKELLQNVLTKRKKGFVEEFDERKIMERIRKLGYGSMREVFVAIADGHVDPVNAYITLFETEMSKKGNSGGKRQYIVQFRMEGANITGIRRLFDLAQKYVARISNARIVTPVASADMAFTMSVQLTPVEQEIFAKELSGVGAKDIDIIFRSKKEWALMAAVILPWALNPVLAKWLLTHGVAPLPLITLRLLTFSVFSIVFFAVWRYVLRPALAPVKSSTLLALWPTIGNAGLSLFTYLALLFMPPSVHLTIMRFNTFLLPAAGKWRNWRRSALSLATFLVLLGGTVALLLFALGFSYLLGILLSVVTCLFYTFYSVATERTLHQYRIDVRQPYMLLHMGILLGLLGLGLLFFIPAATLFNRFTLLTIGYVLLCVCLPHACYSALLKRTRFRHFTDILLIEVPLTMFLEAAILGIFLTPYTYAVVSVVMILLLLWRWEKLALPV